LYQRNDGKSHPDLIAYAGNWGFLGCPFKNPGKRQEMNGLITGAEEWFAVFQKHES
jgi:hypothetical protein